MSSRINFAVPSNVENQHLFSSTLTWTKYVICYEDKNEELVCPAESTSQYSVEAGYVSLTEDTTVFMKQIACPSV